MGLSKNLKYSILTASVPAVSDRQKGSVSSWYQKLLFITIRYELLTSICTVVIHICLFYSLFFLLFVFSDALSGPVLMAQIKRQ